MVILSLQPWYRPSAGNVKHGKSLPSLRCTKGAANVLGKWFPQSPRIYRTLDEIIDDASVLTLRTALDEGTLEGFTVTDREFATGLPSTLPILSSSPISPILEAWKIFRHLIYPINSFRLTQYNQYRAAYQVSDL